MIGLPRTLLGRTALIIALTLIVSQVIAFQLFNIYYHGPRFQQLAQVAAVHLHTLSAALETLPVEEREAFLEIIEDDLNIKVVHDVSGKLAARTPRSAQLQRFSEYVKQQLGGATEFFARDNGQALWVRLNAGAEAYWVSIPRARIERGLPWAWFAWASLAALLALAAAYLLVRRLNQPLVSLAQAAASVGRGESPPKLAESGAQEVSAVSSAFNRMTEDLAALSRERALLLAGVSHDLRTPLTRLRLGVEMANALDDDLKRGMTQDIEDMDAIVQQFLDFARDERAEALEPVDLNVLIAAVREAYSQRGKHFAVDLNQLPQLAGKPVALKRLLTNLLDNAFRYAGAPVEVHTHAENGHTILSVLDRGPGIPAGEVPRLLQPFTRLDPSRGEAGGSGLGLAIVTRIARLHGGDVQLLARDGGGLDARVSLQGGRATD